MQQRATKHLGVLLSFQLPQLAVCAGQTRTMASAGGTIAQRVILWGGCGAAGAAGAASNGSTFGEMIRSLLPSAVEALLPAAGTTAQATAVTAAELQAVALKASLEAFQELLKAQRIASASASWRLAILLGMPTVAAGVALHLVGWARLGWVTPIALREGLHSVTEAVKASVSTLSDSLHARLGHVDAAVAETACVVQQVKVQQEELSAEVQAVGESVASLERRLGPMETDARRSAKGVEVLCDLVASSGLLNNASASSLRRLDEYTGSSASEEAERRAAPARPELPAPPASQSLTSQSLAGAAPSFVRVLMEPPVPTSS